MSKTSAFSWLVIRYLIASTFFFCLQKMIPILNITEGRHSDVAVSAVTLYQEWLDECATTSNVHCDK